MARICSPTIAIGGCGLAGVRSAAVGAALAAVFGCAGPPPSGPVAIPSVPPGAARIWVYREYEPFDSLARPYIRMNGRVIGISEPGGSFYRDVPPGTYTVTIDTVGHDVNQFASVAATAGQMAFIKVESSKLWESDLNYTADTFYTRLIPRETAEGELARSRFFGGG
jgi:hypothetical protein